MAAIIPLTMEILKSPTNPDIIPLPATFRDIFDAVLQHRGRLFCPPPCYFYYYIVYIVCQETPMEYGYLSCCPRIGAPEWRFLAFRRLGAGNFVLFINSFSENSLYLYNSTTLQEKKVIV